jgi:hypothetical protein
MATREIPENFPGLLGAEATDATAKAVGLMKFFGTERRMTPCGGRLRLYRTATQKEALK